MAAGAITQLKCTVFRRSIYRLLYMPHFRSGEVKTRVGDEFYRYEELRFTIGIIYYKAFRILLLQDNLSGFVWF